MALTPVLLPGESHGRRNLVGCSPRGGEESDTTERLHFHFSLWCIGEGNGNPLQYSCLENPRDGGAWWATIYGVAQSQTRLKWLRSSRSSRILDEHVKVKVAQSCPTLCNPMEYTVHGILQARILEWVAFPFSRGSSQPRDRTQVSCIAGRFFTTRATREAQEYWSGYTVPSPVDLPDPGIEPGSPALQVDSLPTELSEKL